MHPLYRSRCWESLAKGSTGRGRIASQGAPAEVWAGSESAEANRSYWLLVKNCSRATCRMIQMILKHEIGKGA